MDDLHTRLDAAIKKRDRLKDDVARVKGRLDSARADLATVEGECRKRGVEPDQLDATIEQLKARYAAGVQQAEAEVAQAEQALAPFLGAGGTEP